jgi:hypothetical protein
MLLADELILPLSLQEICDLYHFDEMGVTVNSAEIRYQSCKSSEAVAANCNQALILSVEPSRVHRVYDRVGSEWR